MSFWVAGPAGINDPPESTGDGINHLTTGAGCCQSVGVESVASPIRSCNEFTQEGPLIGDLFDLGG